MYLEQGKSRTGSVHAVLVTGLGEDGKINLFRKLNLSLLSNSHLSSFDNNRYVFLYAFISLLYFLCYVFQCIDRLAFFHAFQFIYSQVLFYAVHSIYRYFTSFVIGFCFFISFSMIFNVFFSQVFLTIFDVLKG